MMNISIVGNSGGILNKGLGSLIDSSDIVLRINSFELDHNYYEDLGCKTTHVYLTDIPKNTERWAEQYNCKYALDSHKSDRPYLQCYLNNKGNLITRHYTSFIKEYGYSVDSCMKIHDIDFSYNFIELPKNVNIILSDIFMKKYFTLENKLNLPNALFKKVLKNNFGLSWNIKNHVMSTGFLMILLMKTLYPSSNINLFGMYDGNNNHYWNNEFKTYWHHYINEETKYVNILEKNELIKRF